MRSHRRTLFIKIVYLEAFSVTKSKILFFLISACPKDRLSHSPKNKEQNKIQFLREELGDKNQCGLIKAIHHITVICSLVSYTLRGVFPQLAYYICTHSERTRSGNAKHTEMERAHWFRRMETWEP